MNAADGLRRAMRSWSPVGSHAVPDQRDRRRIAARPVRRTMSRVVITGATRSLPVTPDPGREAASSAQRWSTSGRRSPSISTAPARSARPRSAIMPALPAASGFASSTCRRQAPWSGLTSKDCGFAPVPCAAGRRPPPLRCARLRRDLGDPARLAPCRAACAAAGRGQRAGTGLPPFPAGASPAVAPGGRRRRTAGAGSVGRGRGRARPEAGRHKGRLAPRTSCADIFAAPPRNPNHTRQHPWSVPQLSGPNGRALDHAPGPGRPDWSHGRRPRRRTCPRHRFPADVTFRSRGRKSTVRPRMLRDQQAEPGAVVLASVRLQPE